ncbi:NAD(P)H-hydrate epimerase, partial [Aquicoccus sp. SCR17]|nr:NAD(P)H-hydrate epimerase [Carideicomes alvinocaridis]
MIPILTAAQMRATEAAAIDSGAVTGLELMERAGRGVIAAILRDWPELGARPGRALVLCGPGNNGGDGFVVARLLAERGWEIELRLLGEAARLPPDARRNYDRWCELGAVTPWRDSDFPEDDRLVVDALFGTGLSRPPEGVSAFAAWTHSPPAGTRIVAVDMPSGLATDSGEALRPEGQAAAIRADLTVTFHSAKPGHYLGEGPRLCGALAVADIGLVTPDRPVPDEGRPATLAEAPPLSLIAKQGGHKYGHGHAVVLSGGAGRTGAARLSARAALRIGAGLVTL